MRIIFHANFKKQYQKLRPSVQKKFKERRDLFLENEFHPILNNHPLRGKYEGYRSIGIAGDMRVIFRFITDDIAYFVAIGSYSQLYK